MWLQSVNESIGDGTSRDRLRNITIDQWSKCVREHGSLIATDLSYIASSIPYTLTHPNPNGGHGGHYESNMVFIQTNSASDMEVTCFEPGKLTGLEAAILFILCKGLLSPRHLLSILRVKHKIEPVAVRFREQLNPTCKFNSRTVVLFVPAI